MFRIDKGKDESLSLLAKEFYRRLNPLKKTGNISKNSLKYQIAKKMRNEVDVQKKTFYKMLVNKKYKLLNEIVTGTPTELLHIQQKIENAVFRNSIPQFYTFEDGQHKATDFGNEVLNLLKYKSARSGLNFVWLTEQLDIVMCPYCNYGHIMKITKNKKNLLLFEYDHFIPKVIAPYLSLSFYNLVPSCHACNATLKTTTVFNIIDYIHPFVDDFDSLIDFSIDKPVQDNDINSFNVEFNLKTANLNYRRKLDNSLKIFSIKERYNIFKDDVLRLERMKSLYGEDKKVELLNSGIFGIIFSDRFDLLKHIADTLDLPLNREAARHISKGKFKLDIARKFKILD